MNNMYQQAHLANFAPDQSLDKYKKGADPRVINGIMALSEMQDRAADRMHANLASGAASGQMPTVRDKIMQMFQQTNQQQPQQQPNPMMQRGIAAQAHPNMQTAPMPEGETVPEQMRAGGVARLPVDHRMFGYANGGIIAFSGKDNDQEVPRPIGQETPLTPEERARLQRELEMRLIGEAERTKNAPSEAAPAPAEEATSTAGDVGRGIMSAAGKVGDWWSGLSRQREMNRERLAQLPGFFEELTPTQRAERMARMKEIGQQIDNTPLMSPTASTEAQPPAGNKPQLQKPRILVGDAAAEQERLAKAHEDFKNTGIASGQSRINGDTLSETIEKTRARMEAEGKKMTPDDVRAIAARFEKPAQNVGIAQGTTGATPPRVQTRVPGGPTAPAASAAKGNEPATIDQLLEQQRKLLQVANAPAVGPQLPEQNITDKATDYLKAQEDYVKKTGDSDAAKKLSALYDKMERRAVADDDAQAAQRAADARSNLWSFLSNTRGSSLGVAAGRADAALQPLLSEQKKANAEYRKYSYERDMNREKARAEAIAAEDARKRGEFAKAIEHEQKERNYTLEAQKAKDLADHYKRSDTNQLLNIEATRQSAKEGHTTQLEVANIHAAAQRAGFNKPSESERVASEYRRIRAEQGDKAAEAFLRDEERVRSAVSGVKYEGQDRAVQNRAKVYEVLAKDSTYDAENNVIRRLEAKPKRTPQEEARLTQARAYVKRRFDETYQGLYGAQPEAGGATNAAPQRVTTKEEYAKLPSGTTFIAPDGSQRTKP